MSGKPLDQFDFNILLAFIIAPVAFFIHHLFFRSVDISQTLLEHPQAPKVMWIFGIVWFLGAAYFILKKWSATLEIAAQKSRQIDKTIFLGISEQNDDLFLSTDLRTRHTQVIGTTSSGKSESVILPWAIQDIQNRSGLIIVDGKADKSFLDKIYAYVIAAGRASDFRLFSLSSPQFSCSFNPLAVGTTQEVTERVFSSFQFENEYFESVQFRIFRDIIALLKEQNAIPTFSHILLLLTNKEALAKWIEASRNDALKGNLTAFNNLGPREKDERVSGLVAKISHFCADEVANLFNTTEPHLDLGYALKHGLICYFQLPTMYYQFLGASTGKLVLQCLQNAVAKRHTDGSESASFVSVFLDDFQDYIYEGFEALLNKSRSANIGMVFSHQALGDLDKVSPAFRNVVTTNTNIKIVMRNNDPETAEFFANSFGTKASTKETERASRGLIGTSRTGELSMRAVEEYLFHPNVIKSELATGEAIVSIPYFEGVRTLRVKFTPFPNKNPLDLPTIPKQVLDFKKLQDPPSRFDKKEEFRIV